MKTAHLSWSYRRRRTPQEQREFSDAQRRRVEARWSARHADAPLRATRVVEIVIKDTIAPRTIIRAVQDQDDDGRWSRFRVSGTSRRPVSRRGLAEIVATAICPVGGNPS